MESTLHKGGTTAKDELAKEKEGGVKKGQFPGLRKKRGRIAPREE